MQIVNTQTPVNCAGSLNAVDFQTGNFIVTGTLTFVTTDESWRFFADRDSAESLPFTFDLSDGTTSYAHNLPTAQIEFPDPTTIASGELATVQVNLQPFQVDGSYTMQVTKS